MKKKNKLALIFGFVALTSGSVWLGGYIARLLTTYSMFEATELILKNIFNETNLNAVFNVTYPLVNLTFISYLLMVVSFTLFLIYSQYKFKENGWLFIIAAIIYITLPFELLLLLIDYKLIVLYMSDQFSSEKVLELVIQRISKLSSFPVINILSFMTIPFLLIYKPFTSKGKDED